jgi:hypothetical protein
MRALYVMTVVWGPRYCSYYAEYCLPSLLAPGNLGLLSASDGHKLLVCTTAADWKTLIDLPIVAALSKHATPQLIEIGSPGVEPDPLTAKFRHMSLGHRLLTETAHRDGALGTLIAPDAMFSDGTIAAALRHAEQGAHAVLTFAPRMIEEGLFGELRSMGMLPASGGSDGKPLCLDSRAVVGAAIRNLAPDNLAFDWASDRFPKWPSFCYWRAPGEAGILIHSFYHWYVLLDFGVVARHQTQAFDTASIENSWLSDNFPDPSRIRVLQDSDEAMVVSWAPGLVPAVEPEPTIRLSMAAAIQRGFRLRRMREFHTMTGDFQKANTFRYPVRWCHAESNTSSAAIEGHPRRVMLWFFGDVFDEFAVGVPRWGIVPLRAWWLLLRYCAKLSALTYVLAFAVRRKVKQILGRSRVGVALRLRLSR